MLADVSTPLACGTRGRCGQAPPTGALTFSYLAAAGAAEGALCPASASGRAAPCSSPSARHRGALRLCQTAPSWPQRFYLSWWVIRCAIQVARHACCLLRSMARGDSPDPQRPTSSSAQTPCKDGAAPASPQSRRLAAHAPLTRWAPWSGQLPRSRCEWSIGCCLHAAQQSAPQSWEALMVSGACADVRPALPCAAR